MAQHIVLKQGNEDLYLQWESKKWFPAFRALFVFRADKEKAARIPRRLTGLMLWRAKRYCKRALVFPNLKTVPT